MKNDRCQSSLQNTVWRFVIYQKSSTRTCMHHFNDARIGEMRFLRPAVFNRLAFG